MRKVYQFDKRITKNAEDILDHKKSIQAQQRLVETMNTMMEDMREVKTDIKWLIRDKDTK